MTARGLHRLAAGRGTLRLLALALAVTLVAAFAWHSAGSASAVRAYQVPTDPDMEAGLGVRFVRAAVVADGGIVELRYTVLDPQRASRFQNDVKHPPVLHSERRKGNVYRTALMRQGHDLRPGQSYYILYLNNQGSIRPGDTMEIDAGGKKLRKVPVH